MYAMGIAATVAMMSGCSSESEKPVYAKLEPAKFEATIDSVDCHLYTLSNGNGMRMTVTNFGARIVSLLVPDNQGNLRDVVLGFDNIEQYQNVPSDFGATIGRYANRINKGQFEIGGKIIQLPVNNYGHTLHGGPKGWQYKAFKAEQPDSSTITLSLFSPDGDENFPGAVTASVTYTLTNDNSLDIKYTATPDAPTIINLTNHSYFNLSGDPSTTVLDHILYVSADTYTPIDSTFMTTGEMASVADTPFDFLTPHAIGERINDSTNVQLLYGKGYDHNFVLNTGLDVTQRAAEVTSPVSGIRLDVYTDQPGLQIYTGNFLDGTVTGKGGIAYPQRSAIALEAQVYPDCANKAHNGLGWPSPFYGPDEHYTQHTIYKFSTVTTEE